MKKVVCVAVLCAVVTTVSGLETMKRCLVSADSLLYRSKHLKSAGEATVLLSEIQNLKRGPSINERCISDILIPAERNCDSFLLEQTILDLHKKSNEIKVESSADPVDPAPVLRAIPPVVPHVQASPVRISDPVSVSAAQPNVVKQQPAQVSAAVKSVLPSNNTSKTQNLSVHAADGVKSLWQNVSPIIRYPIEASISGISHLYSVNKPAAFAAGLGLAGTALFLSWAGNKCLTNYGGLFCNPFRSPSFSERAAQFFGL